MKIKVPMNDPTYGDYWLEIEAKPVKIPELAPFQFALHPHPLAKTRKNYKPHTVCEVTTGRAIFYCLKTTFKKEVKEFLKHDYATPETIGACIYKLLFGDKRSTNPSREIIKRYNAETRTIEED